MKRIIVLLVVLLAASVSTLGQVSYAFSASVPDGGYLGVSLRDITRNDMTNLGLAREAGVYVESVVEESPAAAAGIKQGDVIVDFAGAAVISVRQFQRLVADHPSGREVGLTVSRDGRLESIRVELGRQPRSRRHIERFSIPEIPEIGEFKWGTDDAWVEPEDDRAIFFLHRRPRLGIRAEALNRQMAEFLGVGDNKGVLVMEVMEDSAAQRAGLKAGDVIVSVDDHKVSTPSELSQRLKEGKHTLQIVRDQRQQDVSVEIEEPQRKRSPVKTQRI